MKNPKAILITGGSSGIGEGLAMYYASPDVKIAITGRNKERLEAVKKSLEMKGATVIAEQIDVADKVAMEAFVGKLDNDWQLDLVVANAGVGLLPSEASSLAEMTEKTFAVNVNGVFHTIHPAIKAMKARQKGQVAIVSSVAGIIGLGSAPSYSASKNAVRAYGEALRVLLAPHGLEINVICPGFVVSRMTDKNTFKMPFLMTTEKAVKIITKGLANNKSRIAFPWQTYGFIRFLSWLPISFVQWITKSAPKKG